MPYHTTLAVPPRTWVPMTTTAVAATLCGESIA